MRAVPMLLFASVLPAGWGISLPVSIPGFFCSLAALMLGLLCVSAMENITMGFTMITLDPRGVQGMLHLLMMILCGNILPLTLFPDSWQGVITRLPFAQMLDAPIRLYTGEYAAEEAFQVLVRQCAWTLLLVFLGIRLWRRNQRHLIVQGG